VLKLFARNCCGMTCDNIMYKYAALSSWHPRLELYIAMRRRSNSYDQLLQTIKSYTELCIPVKTVRVGRRDPDYISPLVMVFSHRRNKLRRLGWSTAADQLTCKTNSITAGNVRSRLRTLDDAPVSEMRKALRLNSIMDVERSRTRNLQLNLENVNTYFADNSFNSQYKEADVGAFRSNVECGNADVQLFAYDVENMLRRVTKTAPGGDKLPYWLFKLCSYIIYELAEVAAHIYNCSLTSSVLPH
jgi:hypothetical protein